MGNEQRILKRILDGEPKKKKERLNFTRYAHRILAAFRGKHRLS